MTEMKINNNNKPTMVSFADTFNPETAPQALVIPTATLVEGQNDNSSGRWDIVWAEAKPVLSTTNHDEGKITSGAKKEGTIDGTVVDPEGGTAMASISTNATDTAAPEQYIQRCNCMVLTFGWSLTASALVSTLMLEVAAATVFICAVGFHWVAETFGGGGIATNVQSTKKQQQAESSSSSCSCSCCNPIACLMGPLFRGLTTLFLCIDTFLLVWSVFVTELLAAVVCLLCTIFGGMMAGAYWHQTVRRLCHLSRWAFREFHTQTPLPRILPFGAAASETESALMQESPSLQTPSSSDSSAANTGSHRENSSKQPASTYKGGEDEESIVVDGTDMEVVDLYDHKADSSNVKKSSK